MIANVIAENEETMERRIRLQIARIEALGLTFNQPIVVRNTECGSSSLVRWRGFVKTPDGEPADAFKYHPFGTGSPYNEYHAHVLNFIKPATKQSAPEVVS